MTLKKSVIIWGACYLLITSTAKADSQFVGGKMPAKKTPQFYLVCDLPQRAANGQTRQRFHIIDHQKKAESMVAFYTENDFGKCFSADIVDNQIILESSKPAVFKLWVVGVSGKDWYIAYTESVLFADSEKKVSRKPFVSEIGRIPFLEKVQPQRSYWPQTGQTFVFQIQPGALVLPIVESSINVLTSNSILSLRKHHGRQASYTPSHDQKLRQTSVKAGRNDILFARTGTPDRHYYFTHTLYVHRSRHAFKNVFAGRVALVSCIFLFSGWIRFHRRNNRGVPW